MEVVLGPDSTHFFFGFGSRDIQERQGDRNMGKKESPIFARFPEDQALANVGSDVKAGGKPGGGDGPPFVTLKFPSAEDSSIVS